ncbi:aminotransferase class V-fold PLP-dependent enzyme [Ruania halotolerans]|uniref:aminotransferase class V-fold PLP-dependent enzyme n=1 Tax=Ruania halotolerans TaxID=2897773 RepID=UPI001E3FCEC8|nr:aminotransferase class V-fold PLP-dependent enzyme [Ruania halotolerans]UFU06408.1 aminotransferase class V-fold PLP-dependent enzyme [Ruania halotolerans]
MNDAAVAQQFAPETLYLNTASAGLPPQATVEAVRTHLDRWSAGRVQAPEFDEIVGRCRELYAALVGLDPATVAVGSQVSAMVAPIAAWVPGGAEVLVPAGEFTSVSFPFLAQAPRGVRVREVPLADLPTAVGPATALVAVAAVQSADGAMVDLPALRAACAANSAEILLDLTQSAGWLPLDLAGVAFTVCAGYKWLLAPRGTGYLSVRADLMDAVMPGQAGWYAGEDRWSAIYGGPLRLAADARRFDVSPAWPAWVGAEPSLRLLTEIGRATLHEHAVGLARRFTAALGLEPTNSAIVSLGVDEVGVRTLASAGIVTATRAGKVRFSFHVHNTAEDVDRVVPLLRGRLT